MLLREIQSQVMRWLGIGDGSPLLPRWARGALDFNGTTSYVASASNSALNNLAALTCAAWVNCDGLGEIGAGRFFDKGSDTTGTGWRFLARSGTEVNSLRFVRYIANLSSVIYRTSAANVFETGVWFHLAATWDGGLNPTNIKLYKNGVETSYGEVSSSATGSVASDAADPLYIGNRSANDRTVDGRMAETGVWNAVLTADEILALGKGLIPARVRPQALVDYRPFVRNGQPWKGGANTDSNVTVASHPRIYR